MNPFRLSNLLVLVLALAAGNLACSRNTADVVGLLSAAPPHPLPVQGGVPDSLSKHLAPRRLFGLLPPKSPIVVPAGTAVRTGKKSTIIYQVGENLSAAAPAKKAGPVAVGPDAVAVAQQKKAGPVAVADSGATIQQAQSQKGPAAAAGRDLTQTTTEKGGAAWWLWVVVFAAGFATRQFGPWLLRTALPALRFKPG